MKTIKDYSNPFGAIADFESAMAEFTGAPYVITTDCCTHAIEIVFRLLGTKKVTVPSRTYLSILMTVHKLGIEYKLTEQEWFGEYQFGNTNVWDSARRLEQGMYRSGNIQCLSFGMTKPLLLGRGGCILTDDKELYREASRMRYDGRDIFEYGRWVDQKEFRVGYHYYMRPEDCVTALNLLDSRIFTPQTKEMHNYPDLRQIKIID